MVVPFKNKADKAAYMKKYGAKPEQRSRRAERNRARREFMNKLIRRLGSKSAAKKAMRGKDVHHTSGSRPPKKKIGGKTRLVSSRKNRNPGYR